MEDQTTTSTLEARINELEEKQVELLAVIESKENEFGIKRAQFKDIFLQKETELKREGDNLESASEENARLIHELENVSGERDNLKTAVLITETTNDDEFRAMKSKYQEEITSLNAIMQDAIKETRQETSAKYEGEHHLLVMANTELEAKLVKYRTQCKEMKAKLQDQDDGNDGLFDVLSGAWKKPANEDNALDKDDNLENSMKKAQENAETLRAIVMPLEQEIAMMKAKLRNANEKIYVFEAKEKKQVKSDSQNGQTTESSTSTRYAAKVEELEEKAKELIQYLEAERSSRTDLEMFVAVLNTQKGVLQEDADKLRRELHNVCRLLEQEKEEHIALKDTWEMANDRFLETHRMQKIELEKIKKILTSEQLQILDEELKSSSESVQLLTPPSPATRKMFLNRKVQKQVLNKKEKMKTLKINSADAKRTLSSLVRGPKPLSPQPSSLILDTAIPEFKLNASPLLPSVNSIPCTVGGNSQQKDVFSSDVGEPVVDHNSKALSDGEGISEVHSNSMKKYKSADDLETGMTSVSSSSLRRRSEELSLSENEDSLKVDDISERGRRRKENIDWKSFEEAAKSSLSNELDRSCAMCINYEKQLQKFHTQKQNLTEESSVLLGKVKQGQETVVRVKRAYEELELSVKQASEDAQAQINAAAETQRNLETLLGEIDVNMDKTRNETSKQVNELMESRDSIMANFEQFQENSRKLPLGKQIEQGHLRDGDANESQPNLEVHEAASKTNEEKLQSEIEFMKDRVMAEQVAKESMEELYLGEIDSLGKRIRTLKQERDSERQQSKKLDYGPGIASSQVSAASNEVIETLEKRLQQSFNDKVDLEKQVRELRSQLHSLNGQLNSSESVQRDFVQLSQSLQMKLEEMKECQKEIGWEHEDDVKCCRNCETQFVESQDKHHCRQCGKIFCDTCLRKTGQSSVSHEPSRVCVDCYDVTSRGGGLDQEENVTVNRTSNERDLTLT